MGGGLCFFANVIEGGQPSKRARPDGGHNWRLRFCCSCQLSPRWDEPSGSEEHLADLLVL